MRLFILSMICLLSLTASAQKKQNNNSNTKPKLVIGIVIDQMRWDNVNRYSAFLNLKMDF